MSDTRRCVLCGSVFDVTRGLHAVCRPCLGGAGQWDDASRVKPHPIWRRPSSPLLGLRGIFAFGVVLTMLVSGCSRAPNPQTAADVHSIGSLINEVAAAGLLAPERIQQASEALERLGIEASRSLAERWAAVLLEIGRPWIDSLGPVIAARVLGGA